MTEDNITTKSSGSDITKFGILGHNIYYAVLLLNNYTYIICSEIKNNLQQVIADAFSLFTDENTNIISITDLGKVIRNLGT